jgi:hypothetical protein
MQYQGMSQPQIGQNLIYLGLGLSFGGLTNWLLDKLWNYIKYKYDIKKGIIYMFDEGNKTIFDNAEVYKTLIRQVPEDVQIKLIITTYGGSYIRCLEILHYLKQHKAGYVVYINKRCQSAGTFLALGAKEIIMDNYSSITKIDCQHYGYSTIYYEKMFLKSKENLEGNDILKSYESIDWINHLSDELRQIVSSDLYEKVKDALITSCFPHEKCYYYDNCVVLGLPVRKPKDDELIYFI